MLAKKFLVAAFALLVVAGGTYAYSSSPSLQGKFGGIKVTSTTTGGNLALGSAPIVYDATKNTLTTEVCGTAITDTKQVELSFTINGTSSTSKFTPKTGCQTVTSKDLKTGFGIVQSGFFAMKATLPNTDSNALDNASSNDQDVPENYYLYDSAALPDLSISKASIDLSQAQLKAEVCVDGSLNEFASSGSVLLKYTVELTKGSVATDTEDLTSLFDTSDSCATINLSALDWSMSPMDKNVKVTMEIDTEGTTPETNEKNNSFTGMVSTGK